MDCSFRPHHQFRPMVVRSRGPLLSPDCASEAYAAVLLPADLSKADRQTAALGDRCFQCCLGNRICNRSHLPVSAHQLLLDILGP